MDIALALIAALLFALGTVLQQRAGLDEPEGGSDSSLLLRMARRPVWLAGIASDALGFGCQAVALTIGRLAVVQPLLVSAVVFALPLGARITGQVVRKIDIGAALLVTGALIAFLTVTNPSGGRDDAPVGEWLIAGGVCAVIVVPLFLLARHAAPSRRAALLGSAAGIMFGLAAALTKAVCDELADHPFHVLVDWHLYALIAIGYISLTFSQLALSTGALAPAAATSMGLDPIASVILGVTLLEESISETPLGIVVTVLSLVAALAGVAILARTQQAPPPKPLAGTSAPLRSRLRARPDGRAGPQALSGRGAKSSPPRPGAALFRRPPCVRSALWRAPPPSFFCQSCGHESLSWSGRCAGCGEWNTLVEAPKPQAKATGGGRKAARGAGRRPVALRDVSAPAVDRLRTGVAELDRVLGGGLVPGSLVLLGGSPGIGKSTLTGMALGNLGAAGHKVLYVSGEESTAQVRLRAERLGEAALAVPALAETSLEAVIATLEAERPDACVIDSDADAARGGDERRTRLRRPGAGGGDPP